MTGTMWLREIPPTYSVGSPMLPTLCCWFFAKCCNAWPYISYGQCQLQLEREYCVKKVNKANSSPSKAVSCYFYHCSACKIHASMNFSTPVRWHNVMSYVAIYGSHFKLSEASLVCVFCLSFMTTTVRRINHEQTNENHGLSFCARYEMYAKRNCKY